ncbi:hypothetical protein [Limnohabitans sp. DM1]|uniref:hypothetical protein n=1 Tax=Limnohabitans sp. DM1 TaxID=1597955 RepID=UPI000B0596D9|nr:hypothetical protein [Limnohabitans sp. DM1]
MKRRTRDFVALFNAFWYRDFPITPDRNDISRRALWTTHIASTVKMAADHLGLYTCFETGGKTDAVIQDSNRKVWAKAEWEWAQAKSETVNEIKKLADAASEADTFFFVGYSRTDDESHQSNLEAIGQQWVGTNKPLVVFLVTFSLSKKRRHFQELQTHVFVDGDHKRVRVQEALPWQVPGTKWQATVNSNVNE